MVQSKSLTTGSCLFKINMHSIHMCCSISQREHCTQKNDPFQNATVVAKKYNWYNCVTSIVTPCLEP